MSLKFATAALISFGLLFGSALGFAAVATDCPANLDGKWFCHEEGMPGDGSDETTFPQSYTSKLNAKKELVSYLIDAEYGPKTAFEMPLDNTWRLEKHGAQVGIGGIYDVNRRYSCENQRLISEAITYMYASKADYVHHRIARSYAGKTLTTMTDNNNLRITSTGTSVVNVCTRVMEARSDIQ